MTASRRETQLIQAARLIENGCCYIVGTGLPLLGAALGKRCVAPEAELLLESGFIGVEPREVPSSVTDLRLMCTASVLWDSYRYMGFMSNHKHYGRHDLYAFIGGAQIDPYGNVNSTCIYGKGDYVKPQVHFTGSGGANGIAGFCNTVIMIKLDKTKFVNKVDYITSCGWMDGPGGRERVGLPGNRGPQMVVTDMGIMKFDEETKRMYLAYYYPYSTPEEIKAAIPDFPLIVDERAQLMEGPTPDIIKTIREDIDPGQAFIKVPKA